MSGLARSNTRAARYVSDPQKQLKLRTATKAVQPKSDPVQAKAAPTSTSKTNSKTNISNKLTSGDVRSRERALNAAEKSEHKEVVEHEDESETIKAEEAIKKVKNVRIEVDEVGYGELDVGDLHKKIIRWCDNHAETLEEELPTWIGKIDRGNPNLMESLKMSSESDGNLLHLIHRGPNQTLEQIETRFQKRRELLRWLVENYPQLYNEKNWEDRTPLEDAMQRFPLKKLKGLNPFVGYFVGMFPEETAHQLEREDEDSGHTSQAPVFQLAAMICDPGIAGAGSLGALLPYLSESTLHQRDENMNTILHLAVRYRYACDEEPQSQENLREQIKELIYRHPNVITALNKANESPYLHRLNTVHQHLQKSLGKEYTYEPDVITDFLKDLCMHKPIDEAVTLLYGPRLGRDHQISLNLQELSRGRGTMTKRKLTRFLDRFKFESILQLVHIPHLTLAPDKTPAVRERPTKGAQRTSSSINDGIGREECLEIIRYLHEKGKVRKIIELIVDDNHDPPHKDSVIATLGTFDIEKFNWKKIDLCSDTIFKAAPHANEIKLYSSGNNAVLRSWSAPDGLGRFTKLRKVKVNVIQRVESSGTTRGMIAQFKERMAENCPQVTSENLEVEQTAHTEPAVAAAVGVAGVKAPGSEYVSLNINTWMRTMEAFATFIRNIPDPPEGSERRYVKVAVIDDGIDAVYDDDLFSNIKGGESFTGEKRLEYFFSSTGHGTLMADLVQRVCPKVHLYIARLDELEDHTTVQPTAESAAKAIRWAIQQDVDIISMSWTVTEKYDEILAPAIKEADSKNILMFGAASDEGYNAAYKVYPAEYEQVFCIGAAKATGTADAAAELQAKYVFPGGEWSDIRAQRSTAAGDGSSSLDHAWGSSFANALAAGLAALILDCAEIVPAYSKHRGQIRKRQAMDKIFAGMIREREKGSSKYIPVNHFFTPEIAKAAWDTEGQKKLKKLVKTIIRPVIEANLDKTA